MSTTTTASIIASTLAAHGESGMLDMAQRVAGIESGGRADAKNTRSSATGLFQFTRGTWESTMPGVPFEQAKDPEKNTEAFIKLTRKNESYLEGKLGRDPRDWEVYLAHFAGPGRAVQLLSASDNAALSSVFSKDAMDANPHLGRLGTVGRYKQWVQAKYNGSTLPDGIPVNARSGVGDDEDHFGDDELGVNMLKRMNAFQGTDDQLLPILLGMLLMFMSGLNKNMGVESETAPQTPNAPTQSVQEQAKAAVDGCSIPGNGVCVAQADAQPNLPTKAPWDVDLTFRS